MVYCRICGEKAEWAVEKRYYLFKSDDRYFCDLHYRKSVRRNDFQLALLVLVTAVLLAAAIFNSIRAEHAAIEAKRIAEATVVNERDFDSDGFIDLWESQATQTQIHNFAQFRYPCESVEGQKSASRAVLATMTPAAWKTLTAADSHIRLGLNYPAVMARFMESVTSPTSTAQLDRVFLTADRDIAFLIRRYEKSPAEWPAPTPSPSKSGKKNGDDPTTPPVAVVDAWICYERLSEKEGLEFATAFGIEAKNLPVAYGSGVPNEF